MDLKALMASCYVSALNVNNDLLREAMEEEAKEKSKRALVNLRQHISAATSTLTSAVATLRHVRKMERDQAALVKKLDRAIQFFLTSGNPLPYFRASGQPSAALAFCRNVGIETPTDDSEAWLVPDDFKTEPAPVDKV